MKMSLGKVIMDKDDAKEEILLMLENVVLHQKEMGACLKPIEGQLELSLGTSGCNKGHTNPVEVDVSTSK